MEPAVWSQDQFEIAPDMKTVAAPARQRATWFVRALVWLFGVWAVIIALFFLLATLTSPDPVTRAIAGMALGLFLFWIVLGGALIVLRKRACPAPVRRALASPCRVRHSPALLEEAVTTTATSTAPLWVSRSADLHHRLGNYLSRALSRHRLCADVHRLGGWATLRLLAAIFILYGCTGRLPRRNLRRAKPVGLGFWVYVYGLMIYLPVCAVPPDRGARKPGVWACLLALILPILAAIPVALIILTLNPPQHAFAPIR